MIKKVNITQAASFNNYNQAFEFEKTNIFFGYNGCGKTTFSRIVSSLEGQEINNELENPGFTVETDSGNFNQSNLQNNLKIKVFNQDYVQKNIHYNSLAGVFVAGEENFEKQKQIENLRKVIENLKGQLSSKNIEKNTIKSTIQETKDKIENLKSETAKYIKDNLIGFDNSYNKTKLDNFKNTTDFQNYKDQEINLTQEIQNYNLPNKKIIKNFDKLHNITPDFVNKINSIFETTVLDSVKIPEITSEFESWARDGMELHKNHHNCVFCGSVLTEDITSAPNP